MLELVAFSVLGILIGIITGLTPGLHVNTVAAVFLSLSLGLGGLELSVIFFSMAITHTFIDFIPSILLGVPSEATALSVLPGHRLVLRGRGQEAILLSLVGCISCLFLGVLLVPVFVLAFPFIYYRLLPYIGILLVLTSAYLILLEKRPLPALFCFALSGLLGFYVLDVSPIQEPLLPLLAGLFGASTLLVSMNGNSHPPPQVNANLSLDDIPLSSILRGSLSGAFVGLLPGLGPAQAAVLSQAIGKEKDEKSFLVTLGGISTANTMFALVALLTIGKKRSGIVSAISDILPHFSRTDFIVLISAALFAGCVSFFIGIRLARTAPVLLRKIDYRLLSVCVLFFISALALSLSGIPGFLVLLSSTAIGLLAHLLGVRKMHLMGVLIVPAALYFLGLVA